MATPILTLRRYRLYGVSITTDLDLSVPEVQSNGGREHLILRRGMHAIDEGWEPRPGDLLLQAKDPGRGVGYVAGRTQHGFRLRFDGVCQFDLSPDLSQASWQMAPAADLGTVAILAAGALVSFRMTMAGHLILHSSAVLTRDRGLAFVGPSGSGKSTMATLLCANGAQVITDDVGHIDFSGPEPAVWPGGAETRLRPATAPLQDLFSGAAPTRVTADGRTAVLLPQAIGDPVPLRAIAVPLFSRDRERLGIHKLDAGQALICLSYFPRLPGWVDPSVAERQFNLLADLAGRVPVYRVVVPWASRFDPAIASQLLDELGWV